MPRITGSEQESAWLRGFREGEFGRPIEEWPSPRKFQKWLSGAAFRRELEKVRRAGIARRALLASLGAQYAWKRLTKIMSEEEAGVVKQDAHEREFLLEVIRRAEKWVAMEERESGEEEPGEEGDGEPEREETVEEAARRLMHPDCRLEVAVALLKGEPHPDRAREEAAAAARAAAAMGGRVEDRG